jgi:hypothetical protein
MLRTILIIVAVYAALVVLGVAVGTAIDRMGK